MTDPLCCLLHLDRALEQSSKLFSPHKPDACCHTDAVYATPIPVCAEPATHQFRDHRGRSFGVCDGHLAHAQALPNLTEDPDLAGLR